MRDFSNATPSEILYYITSRYDVPFNAPTIVILGKPGPTGKTWLATELTKRRYTAVEVSESILDKLSYNDAKNHVIRYVGIDNPLNRHIVIILNKPYDNRTNVEKAYDILSDAFDGSVYEMPKVYAAAHAAVDYLKEEIERRDR